MKKWQIVLGFVLVILGLFSLIEVIFSVNLWRFVGPLLLVGLGLFLILRLRRVGPDVEVKMPILGDIRRSGNWEVTQHEFWWLAGENRLDFSNASFPQGEGTIKIFGFAADVKIILPEDVGLQIETSSFVSELKLPEGKQERFLSRLSYQSPNYSEKDKRVLIQTFGFVSEIRVKPPLM